MDAVFFLIVVLRMFIILLCNMKLCVGKCRIFDLIHTAQSRKKRGDLNFWGREMSNLFNVYTLSNPDSCLQFQHDAVINTTSWKEFLQNSSYRSALNI